MICSIIYLPAIIRLHLFSIKFHSDHMGSQINKQPVCCLNKLETRRILSQLLLTYPMSFVKNLLRYQDDYFVVWKNENMEERQLVLKGWWWTKGADDVMEKKWCRVSFPCYLSDGAKTKLQLLSLLDPDMTSSIMFKHMLWKVKGSRRAFISDCLCQRAFF